jgi:putative ATPase
VLTQVLGERFPQVNFSRNGGPWSFRAIPDLVEEAVSFMDEVRGERYPLGRSDAGECTHPANGRSPLAERMRPRILEEMAGQRHLISGGLPSTGMSSRGHVPSCILYGPPGVGKTSIARLMATMTERDFLEINAVSANVAALRDLVAEAKHLKNYQRQDPGGFRGRDIPLQQAAAECPAPVGREGRPDPHGTTTENPSFEINKTLLSRQ